MKNLKNKITISAALATFNEENNIADCINSLKKVSDEIVIVDGSSQDKTAEFATNLGARVIKTTNKKMFNINKNYAIQKCSGKWVVLLDADERISDELSQEIEKTVNKKPSENGFWINRRNWFMGGFLTKGGAYPDKVIRLFRKGTGKFPAKDVHEQMVIDGEVGYLKSDILHLADPSFARYLKRAIRYTDRTADNLRESKTGKGIAQITYYMLVKPVIIFLNVYIRHKGYRDGFRGFVWALFSGAHHFYAYSKYWNKSEVNEGSD